MQKSLNASYIIDAYNQNSAKIVNFIYYTTLN